MGNCAKKCATKYNLSREDQDRYMSLKVTNVHVMQWNWVYSMRIGFSGRAKEAWKGQK